MTHLDERKASILRAIVEHYVGTAQPAGSATVAQAAELGVSAATVRNEMAVLEREGYIAQPHTSAGRVPTDRGYRYYVDHLAGSSMLAPAERRRIADFFTRATMAMDELLSQTSQLLARVTEHAAVVVGPQPATVVIRGVHLTRLQPRLVLAVIILSNGAVEKEAFSLDVDVSEESVANASQRLARELDGHRLSALGTTDVAGNDEISLLLRATHAALRTHLDEHHSEPLYIGGVGNLAAEHDAFTQATTAQLFELLEHHVVLATVMREMLGPGLTVSIGAENERAGLVGCSLVLAPYLVEGEPAGTVGVLGPTRMDYRKAQAAVVTVSERLGRQLSQ